MPAYNETGKVGLVLDLLCQVDRFNEINVVDDDSTVSTLEESKRVGVSDSRFWVLTRTVNRGTGEAIFTGGITSSVLFFDGGLFKLGQRYVPDLMQPAFESQADMKIGQLQIGNRWAFNSPRLAPRLSGQVLRPGQERFSESCSISTSQGVYKGIK